MVANIAFEYPILSLERENSESISGFYALEYFALKVSVPEIEQYRKQYKVSQPLLHHAAHHRLMGANGVLEKEWYQILCLPEEYEEYLKYLSVTVAWKPGGSHIFGYQGVAANVIEQHGMYCYYCGRSLSPVEFIDNRFTPNALKFEHKIPRSRGGEFTIDNIVPSCTSCNSTKGTKTAREYRIWCEIVGKPVPLHKEFCYIRLAPIARQEAGAF